MTRELESETIDEVEYTQGVELRSPNGLPARMAGLNYSILTKMGWVAKGMEKGVTKGWLKS
jgi:hypothetical protein